MIDFVEVFFMYTTSRTRRRRRRTKEKQSMNAVIKSLCACSFFLCKHLHNRNIFNILLTHFLIVWHLFAFACPLTHSQQRQQQQQQYLFSLSTDSKSPNGFRDLQTTKSLLFNAFDISNQLRSFNDFLCVLSIQPNMKIAIEMEILQFLRLLWLYFVSMRIRWCSNP